MKQAKIIVAVLLITMVWAQGLFATGQQGEESDSADGVPSIEWWAEGCQDGIMDVDHPQSKWLAEEFGFTVENPLVNWNGGKDYLQQLRIRIASGDMPNAFLPWGGIEAELIENGAAANLDGLLQKHMPVTYKNIPEDIWNYIRAQSPNGKDIYYLPSVAFTPLSGMIRGDWLDRLGLDMPTTIEEYEAVLRAFRDNDANGNGDLNDEVPTSGREFGRWMDHLFAPFGVAMVEGYPSWDIYEGELQYSGITPEMRAAIEWIAKLYDEKLLDPETFINKNKVWVGKITSSMVGSWYHGLHWHAGRTEAMINDYDEARVEYLPLLKADGYEGFYTKTEYRRPQVMFSAATSEEDIAKILQFIDYWNDPANLSEVLIGVEGLNYRVEDGKTIRMGQTDYLKWNSDGYNNGQIPAIFSNPQQVIKSNDFSIELIKDTNGGAVPEDRVKQVNSINQVNAAVANYVEASNAKVIPGQFMPATIYDGYPDIKSHKLYQETIARIIIGEWPIEKFDEFVEQWKAEGGAEVTQRAQAFWAGLNQ